eukprot:Blabericola_migrator_1__12285@NODE_767_length_6600_cov_269_135925_g220_i1_p6_GENE_NODE_767_length_6600_cov_269_135925_g220_i1NODE_767_length_6600_cov_269_135925_g220_i1_p6_ORF_typecomplete_len138_score18_06_NODE_767_length_6600_cov_269_135925_g220_i151135526
MWNVNKEGSNQFTFQPPAERSHKAKYFLRMVSEFDSAVNRRMTAGGKAREVSHPYNRIVKCRMDSELPEHIYALQPTVFMDPNDQANSTCNIIPKNCLGDSQYDLVFKAAGDFIMMALVDDLESPLAVLDFHLVRDS